MGVKFPCNLFKLLTLNSSMRKRPEKEQYALAINPTSEYLVRLETWALDAEIALENLEEDYRKQKETLDSICSKSLKVMAELEHYKSRDGYCESCYAEHIANIKCSTE